MRKVLLYSLLLIGGLVGSQFFPLLGAAQGPTKAVITFLTMLFLAFIMIRVGYEFTIDRSRLRSYAVDYGVAATAAAFPWLFCAAYFIFVMSPPAAWGSFDAWTEALLAGRFAAPTSAGVLFAMLAAAGLGATWTYKKARVLAIFDDLDTVLFMIPLKMLIVGVRWQLGVAILVMAVLLWLAWTNLHRLRLPVTWPWVLLYATGLTLLSEGLYHFSKLIDDTVPIHIEILLPAFVLGCMLAPPAGVHLHERPGEERAETWIAAAFMVLVGLSMPVIAIGGDGGMSWSVLVVHVLVLTGLSNLGKMFPLFAYRDESTWRERLALCVGMWPRGEVGAGVLILSLGYGIAPDLVAAAALSLALNLLLTGVFILWAKGLLAVPAAPAAPPAATTPAN